MKQPLATIGRWKLADFTDKGLTEELAAKLESEARTPMYGLSVLDRPENCPA